MNVETDWLDSFYVTMFKNSHLELRKITINLFRKSFMQVGPANWQQYLSEPMALILDGNSEIGAHVWKNICYLICLSICLDGEHSQIGFFTSEKTCSPSCSELLSNKGTMDAILIVKLEYFWSQSTVYPFSLDQNH